MKNLLQELCAPDGGVRALWTGNDGWLLWDGRRLMATDLDLLSGCPRTAPAVNIHEVAAKLDLLLISHGHSDHFSPETCRVLIGEGHCQFAVPESCLAIAGELGIPQHRILPVKPGAAFSAAGAEVSCVRALHGHLLGSVYAGANLLDCGYRFVFGGLSFYQPGDTVLLHEHLEMKDVDVLFVSPTEHNTWVENSVRMIEAISPRVILAQHFGTYRMPPDSDFWTRGYVRELQNALHRKDAERYVIPTQENVIDL